MLRLISDPTFLILSPAWDVNDFREVESKNALFALGALFELNDYENAGRAFRQAQALAPEDPLIIVNNVLCLLLSDRKQEAMEMIEKFNLVAQQDGAVAKDVMLCVCDGLIMCFFS